MEGAKEIVLDASVVVKWFSGEEGSDLAEKLMDQQTSGQLEIVAPDLLIYEVSNALRHNRDFNADDVNGAIKDLLDLELDLIPPNEELLSKATMRAFEFGMTVYDACYLALAELMGLEFITGDEKLYQKIKKLKFVKQLEHLGATIR